MVQVLVKLTVYYYQVTMHQAWEVNAEARLLRHQASLLADKPKGLVRGAGILQDLKGHQLSMSAMDEETSLDADSAEGTTEHRHSASNSQSRAGLSEAGKDPLVHERAISLRLTAPT